MPIIVNTLISQGFYDIAAGEIVYVTQNGILDAIVTLGNVSGNPNGDGRSSIYVDGLVASSILDIFAGARDDNIFVGASGRVTGIGLAGAGHDIVNQGSIANESGNVIKFQTGGTSGADPTNVLTNSGLIATTVNYAINLNDSTILASGTYKTIINNSGTISAANNQAVSLGTANDELYNTGSIFGAVYLGNGNNDADNGGTIRGGLFSGSGADDITNGGWIFGNIDLGTGDDKFNNSGTLKGNFLPGDGFERMFNTGAIFGDLDFGNGSSRFINSGTVTGDVRLGNAGDTGFLNSSHGALYGAIFGGGAGNTIYTSNVGNYVIGGAGTDIVHGGTGDDEVYGFGGQDSLYGGGGSDSLDGGTGSDLMAGGSGDDAYFVESGSNIINELMQGGSGHDYIRVVQAINFDLADKVHVKGDVEDLYMDGLTQNEAINGFGNGLDNTIAGNDGANTLDGRGGNDALFGYDGNDILRGGAGADLLNGGAGGADMADYLVGATAGVTAALDGALPGTGDALGDTFVGIERLRGTDFADSLRGDVKANQIFGQNGADILDGAGGADRLTGGVGADTLIGGTGSDRFVFMSLAEIGDTFTDFIGYDDLLSIDEAIEIKGSAFGGGLEQGGLAQSAFLTRTDNLAQDDDDHFIYRTTDRTLWFDVDGNGAGAAVLVASFQAGATLQYTDIIIV